MRRPAATGLLVDLDGVLRVWDAAVLATIEKQHGLPPGAVATAAMAGPLLRRAVTGEITHDEWMALAVQRLRAEAGVAADTAEAAVGQWRAYRGEVEPSVLGLVREVRAAGRPVGLATNATDLLDADLADLGLAGEFDAVVNSSLIRFAKPAREFYAAACQALRLPPDGVLLVDDDDRAVRGARAAGLSAYRWTGPEDLRYVRAALRL